MKNSILILSFFIAFSFFSCKKERIPDAQPVDLGVKVSYDLTASGYTLPVNDVTVKITNINTGATQEQKTNGDGVITFKSISAGIYDIDAVYVIDAETYATITGLAQEGDITFNASEKGKQIDVNFTGNVELQLIAGKSGDWVIKQIYYAGSDKVDGAIFRDQFFEFYNNTDHVLYADSLYFGQLWGRQNTTSNKHYLTASGQYDWSKSVGMPAGINNDDYVYIRSLFMIPGTGKQYPVEPGESIVMAQTAINHKSPFTGNNGTQISVVNPALTVDLSNADFETYYGDIILAGGGTVFPSDVDNASVPNVEVIIYSGKDMIIDNKGRDSYFLVKGSPSFDIRNLPDFPEPLLVAPPASANRYPRLPIEYIMDAVEVQPNIADDRFAKKLSAKADAGFTYAPKGEYTSQSVIRKTVKIVDGRRILKDTNNSTEDFDYFDVAQPWGFK